MATRITETLEICVIRQRVRCHGFIDVRSSERMPQISFRLRGSDGKGGGKALNYACFVYGDWTFYSLALYQSLVEDH